MVFVPFLTRGIVDICQCVKFIDHDVDVVAADAMTLTGDSFAFVHTRDGMELAVADLTFLRVKVVSNGVNTCWVAYKDNFVSQLFRFQM